MHEKIQSIGQKIPLSEKNLHKLNELEKFYSSIGGVVGYHEKVLRLMEGEEKGDFRFSKAPTLSLSPRAALVGLEAMPRLAEIYPLGGLASRLELRGERGEMLPAAALSFAGYSLLEGLIRDVAAREYLYFKCFGKKIVTPIALMASDEEHNFPYIIDICEKANWFGRGASNFRIFNQPSVPVVTHEGEWVINNDEIFCQPNGHGAIWKRALDEDIFAWFASMGRDKLLIRQINNPIAGVDDLLLSFVGTGVIHKKTFGFASCERPKGVQEGMHVQSERNGVKRISNIEYTDLKKYAIEDEGFPANTNILFADLDKILPVIKSHPLPGLMVNLKENGHGRLESMMQSISDALEAHEVYLTFTPRHKTISSAKKRYVPGASLTATPEGAFYDLMRNSHDLLAECGFELPLFPRVEEYLEKGPSFVFIYNPSLGPLYSIIKQKLRGGRIAEGAKLIIEDPEVDIENLSLEGSLEIRGSTRLKNVKVKSAKISGNFWAEDVELAQDYEVPEGEFWKLTPEGMKKGVSWQMTYRLDRKLATPITVIFSESA